MDNREMIHWWQGYVVITIRGEKLESLINQDDVSTLGCLGYRADIGGMMLSYPSRSKIFLGFARS